jgi:hypothetical protein
MLPGDLLRYLLERRAEDDPPDDRERGGLDPQTIAEFLAYDVPFETPPALSFVLPPQATNG